MGYFIMEKNAEGNSLSEIRDLLNKKWNSVISRQAISKHIKKTINNRAKMIKEEAKEMHLDIIRKSATSDIELMEEIINRMDAIAKRTDVSISMQIKANAELYKMVESRLKISGIGTEQKEFVLKWDMGNNDEEILEIDDGKTIDIDIDIGDLDE